MRELVYAGAEMGSAKIAGARARASRERMGKRSLAWLALAGAALVLLPAATASHTPNPSAVTIAGSLQSELGCPGDWQPDCAATHLAYDAGDDVWQGTFPLPAGGYEYKAALNDSWTENYGLHAQQDGANIPLSLPAPASVKFYYDHKSHWVTDNRGSVIAVAPGSFQSELGCPGDWDPGCLRSWLQDPDGNGIYSFETSALPAGSYEAKVAINEAWDENYGQGGVPGGANIAFTVPVDNAKVTFTYDATTHVLTIVAEIPPGAPDGPGALSHFGLARKDCLGTARNTTSKVWYTVANGVLSDVYYPTVDNTNVETLQYVVTDGSTFTDLQTRDMTYTVEAERDSGGMACKVVATAKSGKYRIETEYVTDPGRNTVLMNVKFRPERRRPPAVRALRPDGERQRRRRRGERRRRPGDDRRLDRRSRARLLRPGHRDERGEPRLRAAGLRRPRRPVLGGLERLRRRGERRARPARRRARADDDVRRRDRRQRRPDREGRAEGRRDGGGKAILALGFGASQDEAVDTAEGSLATGFARAHAAYVEGWRQYDRSLTKPRTERLPGIARADQKRLEDEYYLSANVIKASEDKTFPGAIVASLASPWGQAVSAGDPANTYFGSYREVFARDLYESWTGLVAAGDLATARAATLFLFERQQLPDGSMPRNSLVNGKVAPDSFGTQLDETAYPILMAYQLGLTDASLYADHIKPAANFVAARGPAFGVERWEEQSGYSPSTIAAEIAGLVAAAELARANGDTASAAVWLGVADSWQRQVKGWTVTTTGPLAPRYFIRLSKTGDPNAAISYNVGNGGPTLDQREVIDAGFLELVRLGELPVDDPDIARSLQVVDATIKSTTARGPGLAPLQRRRLRRPRHRRAAVGAERPGHRPSLAGALGRARRAGAGLRQRGRGGVPAPRHEPVRLRRRPDPRAELGAARPGALALRHRPDARLDRLRERRRGRLGLAAHLVGRVVRAARGRASPRAGTSCCRRRRTRATSPTRRARRR